MHDRECRATQTDREFRVTQTYLSVPAGRGEEPRILILVHAQRRYFLPPVTVSWFHQSLDACPVGEVPDLDAPSMVPRQQPPELPHARQKSRYTRRNMYACLHQGTSEICRLWGIRRARASSKAESRPHQDTKGRARQTGHD